MFINVNTNAYTHTPVLVFGSLRCVIVLAKVQFPFYVTTLIIGRAALRTVVLVSRLAAVKIPNRSRLGKKGSHFRPGKFAVAVGM